MEELCDRDGATLAIAVASRLAAPELWQQYFAALNVEPDDSIWLIWWRLPIAAIVVVWGARHDHRWALIVAVFFALPRWYFLSPVMLVGLFPLVRLPRPLPVVSALRAATVVRALPRSLPWPAIVRRRLFEPVPRPHGG